MGEKVLELRRLRFYSKFKNWFFYSSFFPLLIGLICTLSWYNDTPLLGLAVIVFFACYIFLSQLDVTPIIPLLFSVIMIFRSLATAFTIEMYLVLAPVIICIFIRIFKHRGKLKIGNLTFPLILVSVALAIGGAFTIYYEDFLYGISSIVTIGPALLIVYLFFLNFAKPPKSVSLKLYFTKCLVFFVFFACIELGCLLYHQTILKDTMFRVNELGWANKNNIGTLVLMAVPLCFYLIARTGHAVRWFFMIIFLSALGYLTTSSGTIAFLTLSFPFLIIYTYYKSPEKTKPTYRCLFFALISLVIGCVCVVIVLKGNFVVAFINEALSDSGRTNLYNEATSLALRHPLFGVGLGYYNDRFSSLLSDFRIMNFHSTFFHVFATMGVVGLIAYAYYYYCRIKTLLLKPSRYSVFAFVSFMLFACYAMIDTCESQMIPTLIVLTMIFIVAEIDAEKPILHDHLYASLMNRP